LSTFLRGRGKTFEVKCMKTIKEFCKERNEILDELYEITIAIIYSRIPAEKQMACFRDALNTFISNLEDLDSEFYWGLL
jgi:hypothetical protein